jgi:hypothetical protein
VTLVVIVTNIWQKLSSVERDVTLIITNFWQLFSQIFGETLLIVTNIWRNRTRLLSYTILDNAARSFQDRIKRADVSF